MVWLCTHLILALKRQRQAALYKFQISQDYPENSQSARVINNKNRHTNKNKRMAYNLFGDRSSLTLGLYFLITIDIFIVSSSLCNNELADPLFGKGMQEEYN